jgi:hypothetical protein
VSEKTQRFYSHQQYSKSMANEWQTGLKKRFSQPLFSANIA